MSEIPSFGDYMLKPIQELLGAEEVAIETVVKKALYSKDSKYGVKVVRGHLGQLLSVTIDPSVPFGELHEYRDYLK